MRRVLYSRLIHRNKSAQTLVELLFAMLLIAILMWPLLSNFMFGARASMKTGDVIIATSLCTQIMEIVRNKPFLNLLPNGDPLLKPKMDENDLRELVKKTIKFKGSELNYFDERFTRELTLTPVDEEDTMKGKEFLFVQVVVKCKWVSRTGRKGGEMTLCTLIGNEAAKIIE